VYQRVLQDSTALIYVCNCCFSFLTYTALASPPVQLIEAVYMYLAAIPVRYSLRSTAQINREKLARNRLEAQRDANIRYRFLRFLQQSHFMLTEVSLLFICLMTIAIIEASALRLDPNITNFKLLYEMASAFGTVGLSLGYPGVDASLSAVFSTGSKVMMCLAMLIGRHRGLPASLDDIVRVPRPIKNTDVFSKLPHMRTADDLQRFGVMLKGSGLQHRGTRTRPDADPSQRPLASIYQTVL